jgi:hypothetical protein
MTNVKHVHRLAFDTKKNPINVRLVTVKELPHFKRKTRSLLRLSLAVERELLERLNVWRQKAEDGFSGG